MHTVKITTVLKFTRLYCKVCKYYPYFAKKNKSICPGCNNDYVLRNYMVPGLDINSAKLWTNQSN